MQLDCNTSDNEDSMAEMDEYTPSETQFLEGEDPMAEAKEDPPNETQYLEDEDRMMEAEEDPPSEMQSLGGEDPMAEAEEDPPNETQCLEDEDRMMEAEEDPPSEIQSLGGEDPMAEAEEDTLSEMQCLEGEDPMVEAEEDTPSEIQSAGGKGPMVVDEDTPGEIVSDELEHEVHSPQAAGGEKARSLEEEDHTNCIAEEPDLDEMREELRSLLHSEFGNTNHAYLSNSDSDEMWKTSHQVDVLFTEIWNLDGAKDKMDEEMYKKMNKMVEIWITWRDSARTLGVVIGFHPYQEGPMPRFSYQQWKEMLGGKDEYNEIDARLTSVRLWFRRSGAPAVAEISEHIAFALASATRHPAGADYYRDNIVDFNKKLFSWKLDFAS
jgi:hypothetical protein